MNRIIHIILSCFVLLGSNFIYANEEVDDLCLSLSSMHIDEMSERLDPNSDLGEMEKTKWLFINKDKVKNTMEFMSSTLIVEPCIEMCQDLISEYAIATAAVVVTSSAIYLTDSYVVGAMSGYVFTRLMKKASEKGMDVVYDYTKENVIRLLGSRFSV